MSFHNVAACTTWPVILGILSIGWLSLIVGIVAYFLGYRDGLAKGIKKTANFDLAARQEPVL